MAVTNDKEIREALHLKRLSAIKSAPNTIVIDELGLAHAKARIDVAVINGCIHGYEIKSGMDTLVRLPAQLELYGQCLEKLTLVCAARHIEQVDKLAPDWCGIIKVEKGPRGGISFSTVRRARQNPQIDAFQLAHLLWRPEALELLVRQGVSQTASKKSRKELYTALAETMDIQQLTAAIREFMQLRRSWRDRPAHV
ncbi:sce7726 family protein [Phreatobacter stygius]|uniref:Sce7726 family protein n=1 Tax=Phreatobacter stygius TaxID=1940610 RepID=A0A4D7AWR6_9HYPH|nr:sce7726 family protein [Phreatobacter stygius]QCI63945.1 sce7726 family protein [Phreatobacter stygius]